MKQTIADWQKDPAQLATAQVQLWTFEGTMSGKISKADAQTLIAAGTHFVISCQAIGTLKRESDHLQKCCHCNQTVNLDLEGNQYPNGEAAHEHCHDAQQYRLANAADFRD